MDVRFKFRGESVTATELFEDMYSRLDEMMDDIEEAIEATNNRIDYLEEVLNLSDGSITSDEGDVFKSHTNPPK